MPLRMFVILVALFAACVGAILLAWATGVELYVFLPRLRHPSVRPQAPNRSAPGAGALGDPPPHVLLLATLLR